MAVTNTILGQWALAPALGARVACKGSRTGTPRTRLETWGGPTGLPPQTGAPCPCHDFAPPPSAAQTYLECLKNHQMKNNYLIYLYSLPINVSPNNIKASRRTSMPENLSGQQFFLLPTLHCAMPPCPTGRAPRRYPSQKGPPVLTCLPTLRRRLRLWSGGSLWEGPCNDEELGE
jgi:hypothetical protein